MSESKHTPGPWNRVGFGIWTESDGNRRVACAEVDDGCGPYKVQTEEEAKANAQLIAAAPELLAACRQIVWKLSHYCYDLNVLNSDGSTVGRYTGPVLLDKTDAVIKLVERAIAKATGSET